VDRQYHIDRERSDKVLADARWVIERAIGWNTHLAVDHLDNHEATDVLADCGWQIAIRSRSYGKYFEKYGNEFTLRSCRGNGMETELSKIRRGFGDYLFYGFAQGFEHRYFNIIDLAVFRKAVAQLGADAFSNGEIPNTDGETFFRAFDVRLFKAAGFPIVHIEGAC
jgi:hypothetical protein